MTRQIAFFLISGGLAAAANVISRVVFSLFLPYAAAIVAAFIVGLSIAFVLNRQFVFVDGQGSAAQQFVRFTVVNLFGLVQTLIISLLLAELLLPAIGWSWHPYEIAHAVGVIVPVVTSFFGHKHFSFRRREADR